MTNQQFGRQSDKNSHLVARMFPSDYILFQLIAHFTIPQCILLHASAIFSNLEGEC